jgi:hypothetical protein
MLYSPTVGVDPIVGRIGVPSSTVDDSTVRPRFVGASRRRKRDAGDLDCQIRGRRGDRVRRAAPTGCDFVGVG